MAANPALWADVSQDLAIAESSATQAAARAVSLSTEGSSMDPDARADREYAVGFLLHNCYGACESALERLVRAIDGDLPSGRDHHRQLLRRAAMELPGVRPGMISPATADGLNSLRTFRHAFRHAYDGFSYTKAAPNVGIATDTVQLLKRDLEAFMVAMDIVDRDKWP